MNRFLWSACVVLVVAGMAGATTIDCATGFTATKVDSSLTLTCGGLTFNNFDVIPATPATTEEVDLVTAGVSGGDVFLEFNPNFNARTAAQDVHLYYEVSGAPISAVDLHVGGSGPVAVIERVCGSGPIPTLTNLCPGGDTLANFNAFTLGSATAQLSRSTSPIFIYKDVGAGTGATLTSFSQSYTSSSTPAVPEPATFLLIGPALIGLGFLRRRLR